MPTNSNITSSTLIDLYGLETFWTIAKEYFTNMLNQKQEKLVSGNNIKTVNGESILGSGNIVISSDDIDLSGYATKDELNAKYAKPSGGIPKTDLESSVQTSLGKADTALQSYTEQYQGTVQSVATSETLDEVNTTTYVKYVAQTLTDAQKAQARANIGAAAVGEGGGGSSESSSNALILDMDYLPDVGDNGVFGIDVYTYMDKWSNCTSVFVRTPTAIAPALIYSTGTLLTIYTAGGVCNCSIDKNFDNETVSWTCDEVIYIGGGSSGGSGEDNRYFTDFTVEEFMEACISYNTITESISELVNAVNNNKIICVPYKNNGKGFLIATYKKNNSEDSYWNIYLETDGAKYMAYCQEENDFGDPVGLFGGHYVAYVPQNIEVEVSEDGYNYLEIIDNIYHIIGEINYLAIILGSIINSSTIRFTTGAESILEIYDYVLWANGNAPVLEPYTSYELSIARGYDGFYAVLVPFKYVEVE